MRSASLAAICPAMSRIRAGCHIGYCRIYGEGCGSSLNCRAPTGEDAMGWIFILIIVLYLLASLRVLKQYERGFVFLLGRFAEVRKPGLTPIFVPIQHMVRVSLRIVTMQI